MLRSLLPTDIIGKTVVGVENNAVNVVKLYFSDQTTLELWAEDAVRTPYGGIPGIFVEDEPTEAVDRCCCDDDKCDDNCCRGCD